MTTHDIYLAGAGMFLPPPVSTQVGLDSGRLAPELLRATKARSVRVAGDTPAPDLAIAAVKEAVGRSGLAPDQIDLLTYSPVWHQGPECWSAPHYVLRYGVGRDMPAIQLTQACNGGLAALDMAASYLEASPERNGAVIAAAENFGSPLVDRWSSCASCILGDSGTALVLSKTGGFARVLSTVLDSAIELEDIDRTGQQMFPPRTTDGLPMNHQEVIERYLVNYQKMMPPFVGIVMASIRKTIERALGEAGIGTSDIARICHINSTDTYHEMFLYDQLGLDPSAGTREFGRDVGHLGAGDTLAAFTHLVETGQVKTGDNVVLISTAPGHAAACAVVRMIDEPHWTIPAEGR